MSDKEIKHGLTPIIRYIISSNPITSSITFLIGMPLILFMFYKNSGLCIERGKVLSDQELMGIALQEPFQRAYKLPEDDSIKSYLKNHPNCCKVFQDKGIFNLYGLLSGQRRVNAWFKTSPNSVYFFQAEVNACGELPHYDLVFAGEETGSPDSYFN